MHIPIYIKPCSIEFFKKHNASAFNHIKTRNRCFLKNDSDVRKFNFISTIASKEKYVGNIIENFCSWLLYNGVYVYNKSTWGRPPHSCVISDATTDEGESSGRGLLAYKNIAQGEKIIEIPEKLVLFPKNNLKNLGSTVVLDDYDSLAIFVLQQRALGSKSKWKIYFDILPEEQNLNLVFRWNLSDLLFLKGTKTLKAALFLKEKIKEQYNRIDQQLFQKDRILFPTSVFNLQSWEWALSVIFSRSIFLKNLNAISLVPYIDLLNHNPFSISYIDSRNITFSENYEISIYSDRSVNKYEQIFMTYGQKTNLELLLLYGFVLERNPFDSMEIRLSISNKDEFLSLKRVFLENYLKTESVTFPIFYSRYPSEFIEFLRFCIMSSGDLEGKDLKISNLKDGSNLVVEKIVRKIIIYLCERNIKKYSKILGDESLANLNDEKIRLTKNQKIALKQIKCEKKIINNLRLNFVKSI